MKIIKRGKIKKPVNKKHVCTCEKCDTVFECNDSELLDGGVSCPVCYTFIQIISPKKDPYNPVPWIKPRRDERWEGSEPRLIKKGGPRDFFEENIRHAEHLNSKFA